MIGQPHCLAVECRVVRHKFFFDQILIQHRMPSVLDDESQRTRRAAAGNNRKSRAVSASAQITSSSRDGRSRFLNRRQLAQRFIAQFLEKLVFEMARPLVGAENLRLHFFQFRRDEALAADRGLLAGVMRRAHWPDSIS